MKTIARIILTIIFIPVFLLFLFAVNLRFQLLVPSFWQRNFESNNTYLELSSAISKNLETHTISQGGKASDIEVLTNLVSPENLKEIINKNIFNILTYANGKSKEIAIYIPVNKIPNALITKNFGLIKEQMSITDVLKEFNMTGISPEQIKNISRLGIISWLLLTAAMLLTALIIYTLYVLTDAGKRLTGSAVALALSGLTAFPIYIFGTVIIANLKPILAKSANLGDVLIGIVVPPIIQGILTVWSWAALIALIAGLILFFVKKPVSHELKKKI